MKTGACDHSIDPAWDSTYDGSVVLQTGAIEMSREQKSNKEAKKKAALTPKEKKAAKRAKKNSA